MVTRDIRRNKSFGNLNYKCNTYIHTIYVRLSRVYYIFFYIFKPYIVEMKNDIFSIHTFCAFSKVAPFGGESCHATGIFATSTKIRRREHETYVWAKTGEKRENSRLWYPLGRNSTNGPWALRNIETRDFLQFPVAQVPSLVQIVRFVFHGAKTGVFVRVRFQSSSRSHAVDDRR